MLYTIAQVAGLYVAIARHVSFSQITCYFLSLTHCGWTWTVSSSFKNG